MQIKTLRFFFCTKVYVYLSAKETHIFKLLVTVVDAPIFLFEICEHVYNNNNNNKFFILRG